MKDLKGSFENINWTVHEPGMRDKSIVVGEKTMRLVSFDDSFDNKEWCQKGHIGFVLEGAVTLNIDGNYLEYRKHESFVLKDQDPDQRHYPVVKKGESVLLLLIEDAE